MVFQVFSNKSIQNKNIYILQIYKNMTCKKQELCYRHNDLKV